MFVGISQFSILVDELEEPVTFPTIPPRLEPEELEFIIAEFKIFVFVIEELFPDKYPTIPPTFIWFPPDEALRETFDNSQSSIVEPLASPTNPPKLEEFNASALNEGFSIVTLLIVVLDILPASAPA